MFNGIKMALMALTSKQNVGTRFTLPGPIRFDSAIPPKIGRNQAMCRHEQSRFGRNPEVGVSVHWFMRSICKK